MFNSHSVPHLGPSGASSHCHQCHTQCQCPASSIRAWPAGNGAKPWKCVPAFFLPDVGDIDWSINVNVLAVVCCFPCLLIKIMQNEGKAIFLGKKWNTINGDWIQPTGMWWGCLPPTRHEDPHNNWGKKLKCFILTTLVNGQVFQQCFDGRFA